MEHITAASERLTSENATIHSWPTVLPGGTWTGSMELARQLVQMNAVAIKLPKYFHQAVPSEQSSGLILVPVDEALTRLVSARKAACSLGVTLSVFACTEARSAVAINGGRDPRDRKYLSGWTSFGDLRAYCGGLDAAISRAVIYAPHADVVCFKSATPDISEAKRFASAIRAASPQKQLAFGYSPKPNGLRWNDIDHVAFESELYSVGFDYYFFTLFGSIVFPHVPSLQRLVMLDDALKTCPPVQET